MQLHHNSICLVTDELHNIASSGIIGISTISLAKILVNNKFRVKILYTNNKVDRDNISEYKKYFDVTYGIDVDFLDISQYNDWNPPYLRRPKAVYEYFMSEKDEFDIVLFHEYLHDGYYCLKCKNSMPCFDSSVLGVICHGSTEWISELKKIPICLENAFHADLERACVCLADFILAPSQYLIQWMKKKGWPLPDQVFVIPYPMGDTIFCQNEKFTLEYPVGQINEIVFLGDLEESKGINIFISSLQFIQIHQFTTKTITFLGRDDPNQSNIRETIQSLQLPVKEIKIFTDWTPDETRDYFLSGNKLAILPYIVEISPGNLYMCLENKIPFLCSSHGGQKELIHQKDHRECLFDPRPQALAKKMNELLTTETYTYPVISYLLQNAVEDTRTLFFKMAENAKNKQIQVIENDNPLVSIIIPTYNRPELLPKAVESALSQTYPNYEIVIVDDGSTDPEVPDVLKNIQASSQKIRIIRQENKYLGPARNTGVLNAKGEFVVFLDDDNMLFPEFIDTCYTILRREHSQCVLPVMQKYNPEEMKMHYWTSAGGGCPGVFMATSTYDNLYGDACMFIKRELCLLHPFSDAISGWSDWAILLAMHLSGISLSYYPRPLYDYLDTSDSMLHITSPIVNFRNISESLENQGKHDVAVLAELYRFCDTPEQHELHACLQQEIEKLKGEATGLKQKTEVLKQENARFDREINELRQETRGYNIPVIRLLIRLLIRLARFLYKRKSIH